MLYLILAILLLILAHIIKSYRLGQFIELYEKPNNSVILESLSLGYIINFIVPFRLGELFRAWFMGKKMKNGLSFSLALVIIDRILDIIVVGFIFIIFYLLGFKTHSITFSILFYAVIGFALLVCLIMAYKFRFFVKKIIQKTARIFNENIELKLLKFSWCLITSFKDMILKINKWKLVFSTIVMWGLYLLSYYLFALSSKITGHSSNLVDVFTQLFSNNSFDLSTTSISISNQLMIVYLLVPLIVLIIISMILNKFKKEKMDSKKYLELLPQANIQDKLVFLEGYFSSKSSEYYNNYIMLNQDISILQDYSAGSNATTILCTYDNQMFFRKYSFGKDSTKLYEQTEWLNKHKKELPLTKVLNIKKGEGYCSYDMPYYKEAITCFNYVHSVPIKSGWKVLEEALESLEQLYKNNKYEVDDQSINEYIEQKVLKNIEKIENGKYIKPLLKYDTLIINGKEYKNLKHFKKYLTKEYLYNLLKETEYSDIHGDFTIENIICFSNNEHSEQFYIIDPNTGNIYNSPYLDYGKLLQSLHGGYEFFMNTKNVEINENQINYLSTKSLIYDKLYQKYDEYLNRKFEYKNVKNIYFQEIIHWLRLMPYKIEKNGERSVLFYVGFIMVLNDVIEKYGDKE